MRLVILFLVSLGVMLGQTPTRISVSSTPAALQIRPHSEAILQVKVYGNVPDGERTREARLRQAGWTVNIATANGGWVSKPFRFQGSDPEPFYEPATGLAGSIFRQVSGQLTVKDSLVYHAPEAPGKYTLEFSLGGLRTEVEVVVDPAAPLLVEPAEKWTFGPETPIADPYRKLAEHYSPYVAQETWFDWRADAICRVDYDNDWDGGNNWDNLGSGSTQAYVYYAAIESSSHWFLIYNFFHARDYSDNCLVGTCHENDNEGAIVAVRKDGSEFGRIEAMETLAHNNIYSYTTGDSGIRNGVHSVDGPLLLHNGSHPVVFLEAGGHGALGAGDKKSYFDGNNFDWKQNTGLTYVYKGVAERPRHGVDREVGYELLPIYHHWWARATPEANQDGRLMSAFYRYTPAGNRPRMRATSIAGSFYGIKHGRDKAKPFWGWHDVATQRRKVFGTGQWGADPAYGFSMNLRFPADRPMSTDYVFNPYLDVAGPEPEFVAIVRNLTDNPVVVAATTDPSPAVSPATSPEPAALKPSDSAPAAVRSGSCTVEVTVDGTVAIQIVGDRPRYEVLVGAPEREISQSCTAPIPRYYSPQYRLEKSRGRGEVKLVDPAAGRLEIRDPARGADTYRFTLHWEVTN